MSVKPIKSREWHLCCTIANYQDMLAEGPPSWERDRNARCEREIKKASDELVRMKVDAWRKRMARAKKCLEGRAGDQKEAQ